MKRIGVFVDVSNLYYCLRKKYGRKLNYKKYVEFIEPMGTIAQAIAYGAKKKDDTETVNFINYLKHAGFWPKYKEPKSFNNVTSTASKADWDVGIAIDIVSMCDRLDLVVLGTADGDLEPVVKWLRTKGIDVIVLACNISRDLKSTATKWIEIPESLLVEQESQLPTEEASTGVVASETVETKE